MFDGIITEASEVLTLLKMPKKTSTLAASMYGGGIAGSMYGFTWPRAPDPALEDTPSADGKCSFPSAFSGRESPLLSEGNEPDGEFMCMYARTCTD